MDYFDWRTTDLKGGEGIVVGSDQTQEWLLPWWWEHYRKHNDHRVAFVDFGLSFKMKDWCRERGELIPLRIGEDFVKQEEELAPSFAQYLREESGNWIWKSREVWFKKPLASLQSPFDKTIWIDIDCEIRESIRSLFALGEIAIAKDPFESVHPFPIYNSGVIVFPRLHPLIKLWAEQSVWRNGCFRGDQDLLSALISEKGVAVTELSPLYNWSRRFEEQPDVVILHWHGDPGRAHIRHQIWSKELL